MNINTIVLIILTIIQIPSFGCALQILRFDRKDNPLKRLPNHILMCLLIISVWAIAIDLPFTQAFLWSNSVPIRTESACIFYNLSYICATELNRILMALMCVERHFLVFSPQLYRTHRSRLLFHYIPLILAIFFVLIYFIVTNIFISCPGLQFNYSRFLCGYTCAILLKDLGTTFAWIHVFVPTVITIIASVLLPIRFVIQKRKLHRLQWHRARKMILQTTVIASAYIICWLPYTIILQLSINGIINFYNPYINVLSNYGPYATSLLTPFIVQHTIPGWMNMKTMTRIKNWLFPQWKNSVRPATTVVA